MVAFVKSCHQSIYRIARHLVLRSAIPLFILSLAAVGQTQQVILGTQQIQNLLDGNSSGIAGAFPVVANSSGQVNYLSVFLDGSNTAATVWVAVYASGYGHPTKLLSQAAIQHPVPGQWNPVPIPSVQVERWRQYWVALLGVNGQIQFRDSNCYSWDRQYSDRTRHSETSLQTNLTSLPAIWSTGSENSTCRASVYGFGGATSNVSVTLSPPAASLQAGQQTQFTAAVSGTTNTAVTWKASGGTVTSAGQYTAPSSAGTYTVTATSAADSTKSASAVVTVSQPVQVSISVSPTTANLQTGGQQTFSAAVSGTTNTAVTWTASGGTVTSAGQYTAPSSAGTYTVTATSAADSTKSASAVVTVSQPVQVSISVSPTTANLQTGGQQTFSAAVSGTTNTAVTWTASGGTVTSGGQYTAPSSAGTYTVTATSAADSTKSASAVVTVSQPVQVSISVSPTTANLQTGGQQTFNATVGGTTNTAVTWKASGGTVTSAGQYTAPSSAGTYTVTATSAADTSKSASAVVTVSQPVQVSISVSPTTASLQTGGRQTFNVAVSGTTNMAVTWTASGGTVTSAGQYTAPSSAGTYTVTATSAADTSKSASAVVTVSQPVQVAISVSPTTASLQTGGQQQFTATVAGTTNTAVTWAASGGTVTSGGQYTAPSSAGTYTVTATSAADTSKSASAVVTVSQPVQVSISVSPTTASLQTGKQQTFTAAVSGTTNTAVTWAASGGTVTSGGQYTAPASAGTYTVTATSAADTSKSASATVTVTQPIQVSISVSPTTASLQTGGQQTFTAYVSGTNNTAVTWSGSGGTVTTGGLYTAPSATGTYTVTATSVADSTKSASATVNVSQPQSVGVSISPTTVAMPEKWQQQFAATVSGSSNTAISWAVTQGTGTITSSGLFTAPQAVETDVVTATSQADTTKSASATISVAAPHSVSLSWSPSSSSGISSYKLYRGTASGGPYSLLTSGLSSTTYTDSTVQSGSSYYYVTTAVNSSGQESGYSGEAKAVIPMP